MNDDMQNPVPTPSQEARQWAMFCHFAAFLGLVFPFGNLLGPLIIWQIKKDLDPFVDAQGKEALNFQITVGIIYVICGATSCFVIPIFIMMGVGIAALVLAIMAAVKANDGVTYRYPFTLRLIK